MMEGKSKSTPLITYIHEISGQLRRQNIIESEHAYAKFWNRHPDPTNKSRPAKFLFMKSFTRWPEGDFGCNGGGAENDLIDVDGVDDKSSRTVNPVNNPLVVEVNALTKGQVTITEEFAVTDSAPNKTTWSNLAQRIWAKALNILYTDRLIRLSIEGTPNEIITKKMISHKCANKFRHLFASLAFWDPSILSWLHATLLEHVSGQYLIAYHESMQLLRSKIPTLVDRFYLPSVHNDPIRSRNKGPIPDPIQNVLNNHKPKRIKNCPLFILVPNGPSSSTIPQRLKHWQSLFASLGKIITLSINYRPTLRVKDCLNEIMIGVRDKINECRTTFTEGRPIILVGFGHSSLIAAHVALDPACKVTATICLGFPLAGVNGFRGDLDDPLLDTAVPTLFVIGQNATLSSIDDVEDFRERITKTETGLVVVGGANDHLVVSQTKQKFTGITQAIVDRCISDEIYDFINFVMNPHFVPSENNYVSAAAKNLSKISSSTTPGVKGEKTAKSKPKNKTKIEKLAAKEIANSNLSKKLGGNDLNDTSNSNKDSEINTQSTVGVNTDLSSNVKTSNVNSSAGVDSGTPSKIFNNGLEEGGKSITSGVDNGFTSTGTLLDNINGSKAKSKAKKSRPKSKKKEEPKNLEEISKLITGKDGKLERNEITSLDDIKEIRESKQNKDLKDSKESKQDKKEGDKEMKEGKLVIKTVKEPKESKKKDSTSLASSMTYEPGSTISTQAPNQPPLPPPLLIAPSLHESPSPSLSTTKPANFTSPTHGDNGGGGGGNVTPSQPPPLITAPVSLNDNTGGSLSSSNSTILTSKRKKISTKKYDPDGMMVTPAKKKREEPVMSVSSLEKIERTLDEVIATSVLGFNNPPSPSLSIESNVNLTLNQSTLDKNLLSTNLSSISSSTTSSSSVPQSGSLTHSSITSNVTSVAGHQTSTSSTSKSSISRLGTTSKGSHHHSSKNTGNTKPSTPMKTNSLTANSSSSLAPTPTTTTTTTPSTTSKSGSSVNRDYVFSYEVSEVTTLPHSSSNTRTRTIRAPKQLDI